MDDHNEVVLLVARDVDDHRFARFGLLAAPSTKRPLFENLPACRRNELGMFIEDHEIEVILSRFEKDEVFAVVLIEIAGDHSMKVSILDGRLIAVEFLEFPTVAAQRHP